MCIYIYTVVLFRLYIYIYIIRVKPLQQCHFGETIAAAVHEYHLAPAEPEQHRDIWHQTVSGSM